MELLDILYQNPALALEELVSDPAFSQRPATLPCEEGEGRAPGAVAQAAPTGLGQAYAAHPSASTVQVAPTGGFGRVGSGRSVTQPVASSPSFAVGDAVSDLGQASVTQQGSSLYDEVIQPTASETPGTPRVAAEPVAAPRTFAEFTI